MQNPKATPRPSSARRVTLSPLAPMPRGWYQLSGLDRLARELFSIDAVASAVALGASVRLRRGWASEIGAAGRLGWGEREYSATGRTWFDLASITKPITALTVARLARARKLDLLAPLGALLPEARGTPSQAASLELLLSHRAGLESHRPLFGALMQGKLRSRHDAVLEAARARRADATGPIPSDGFAPVYSDLGYLLVGEALARATATPLDELFEREVLTPLGAEIASVRRARARDARFDTRVAATEVVAWRGGTLRGFVHDENAWAVSGEASSGHAGLFGTVAGVLAVGRAVVDALHGRAGGFLTKDEIWPLVRHRPLGTLRAGFDGKSERGSLAGTKFGPSTIGHLGFTGTSLWCDVDRELVGVLLTNRVHPTRDNQRLRQASPRAYDRIAEWAEMRAAGRSA
jgi:CubicO group peptidase (beta-lactamase class C family)